MNGTSSTANLPVGGGGISLEKLDVSNLPKDFSAGDTLIITHSAIVHDPNPSDWSAELPTGGTNWQVESDSNVYHTAIITIANNNCSADGNNVEGFSLNGGAMKIIGISSVSGVSNWNSGSTIQSLFTFISIVFNGAGVTYKSRIIYRNNIGDYVRTIYRIKANN